MLGLVLGGGAARGYAHIGVLRYLDEQGIRPDLVVGTSFGALVGGFYAAGYPGKKIEEIAVSITKWDKFVLFGPSPTRTGLVSGERIRAFLRKYLKDRRIEDCRMRYAAVTVDLDSWEEVVITEGSLVDAIYASISMPVILTPRKVGERLFVDGGMKNPLPIRVARRLGADRIIAVNVLKRTGKGRGSGYSIPRIFMHSFDIMTSVLIEHQLEALGDGILIDINPRVRMDQFERARVAIVEGYKAAKNTDFSSILSK